MTDSNGREYVGSAKGVKGKTTNIKCKEGKMTASLQSVKVIGREELTNSEKARDELILLLLQGRKSLRNSPFIRSIWFLRWKKLNNRDGSADVSQAEARELTQQMGLNPSQQDVGLAMLSGPPIVIAHGEYNNFF